MHRGAGIGTLVGVKRWSYLVLGGILILGAVLVYRQELELVSRVHTAGEVTTIPSQPRSAPQPVSIVWQPLDRTMDGFKVEMPANAKQIKIPAYNESGGSEPVDMVFAYPDPEICYAVAWEEDPPVERVNKHVPGDTLDMALNGALDRSQTMLVGKSEISQQGFPGRDFSARNAGGGVFSARLVLARNRLYMLTAAYPSADARREQDVARFFDSFSVVAPSRNN